MASTLGSYTVRLLWGLAAAIAACGVFAGCGGSNSSSATPPTSEPKLPSLADLVQQVRTGVMRIEVQTCDGLAVGTGFLVAPRLVATVEHVVDGAVTIDLKRAGKTLGRATVIGQDRERDLALLRTDRPIKGYRFKLANRRPRLGEDVAALGFPLGLPFTVTRGAVSGLNRAIPIDNVVRRRLVQTDASVNPGNSGGPLLTSDGRVIGLIDLGSADVNGIAFAVSSEVAGPLLKAWQVAPQPVSATTCESTDAPQVSVTPSPEPTPSPSGYEVFPGSDFTISYPDYWDIETNEADKGAYFDTTIRNPDDRSIMLRVDVTPQASSTDPLVESRPVVTALRRAAGYRELDYSVINFGGYDALYWEFLVEESGVVLHKIDVIFVDDKGRSIAVLTQAPASSWDDWTRPFDEIRGSIQTN
jgi:hypothetical protein